MFFISSVYLFLQFGWFFPLLVIGIGLILLGLGLNYQRKKYHSKGLPTNSLANNMVLSDRKSSLQEIFLFYKDYKPKKSTTIVPIIGGIAIALTVVVFWILFS